MTSPDHAQRGLPRCHSPAGLVVADLDISYGRQNVLSGLSFSVPRATSCALVGPSGSGKSSVLDVVAGISSPASGTVIAGDTVITGLSPRQAASFRSRHVGLVSQSAELLDELNVVENVALPLRMGGVSAREAMSRAQAMLDRVGVGHLVARRVDEVSGGEAQRVAIARALCRSDLRVVLADEPTAALDRDNAGVAASLLTSEATRAGAVVLLATHDPLVVLACDMSVDLRQKGERP